MIIIISTCADKLHETEFVKPIENVLKEAGIKFNTKFYKEINDNDLENCDKIIISGTSLDDYESIEIFSCF
jgi:hypothetical protein